MYPVLIAIGPLKLYALGIFLILSWLVFSFSFWRMLRQQAVDEEHIFDITFYATIAAIIAGRAVFVAENLELFEASVLQIPALWVVPGLSFYGAFIGALIVIFGLAKRYGVRFMYVLDALGIALPFALIVGAVGALLDGSVVGVETTFPWGVRYAGHEGLRHPVQAYIILGLIITTVVVLLIQAAARKRKWPYGIVGVWYFILSSAVLFLVEYLVVTDIYFMTLTINQWILIAIFAESIGGLYVLGGGKEFMRTRIKRLQGGLHATLRRRDRKATQEKTPTGEGDS